MILQLYVFACTDIFLYCSCIDVDYDITWRLLCHHLSRTLTTQLQFCKDLGRGANFVHLQWHWLSVNPWQKGVWKFLAHLCHVFLAFIVPLGTTGICAFGYGWFVCLWVRLAFRFWYSENSDIGVWCLECGRKAYLCWMWSKALLSTFCFAMCCYLTFSQLRMSLHFGIWLDLEICFSYVAWFAWTIWESLLLRFSVSTLAVWQLELRLERTERNLFRCHLEDQYDLVGVSISRELG